MEFLKEIDTLIKTIEHFLEFLVKHPIAVKYLNYFLYLIVIVFSYSLIKNIINHFYKRKCFKCYEKAIAVIEKNSFFLETVNNSINQKKI